MKCPVCGTENEAGAVFCYQCGGALLPTGDTPPAPATGKTVALGRLDPSATPPTLPPIDVPQTPPRSLPPQHDARVYEVPARPKADTTDDLPTYTGPASRDFALPERPRVPDTTDDLQRYPVTPSSSSPYVVSSVSVITSSTTSSNLAVISLILGILSWFLLPLIGGIAAVVTGHMARREIQASGGRISGTGLAFAGLLLGYLNLTLGVFICLGIAALLGLVG